MDEHLAEAEDIIYYDLIIDPSPTATLPAERLRALGIASTDAVWASRVLEDDDLALSICTLYLLPNLEDAYQERWDYRSREAILVVVTSVLQKAGKIDGLIDLYKWWISWDQCRNNADANCARLAELLIGQKRYEEAISYLKMIDETGECAASRGFIPILEARLREQQASNQGGQQ
jgi:tetratricopeptide (TPR) repeat protein